MVNSRKAAFKRLKQFGSGLLRRLQFNVQGHLEFRRTAIIDNFTRGGMSNNNDSLRVELGDWFS